MNTKLTALFLAVATMGLIFTGCEKNPEKDSVYLETVVGIQTERGNQGKSLRIDGEQVEVNDKIAENNITIVPQGDMVVELTNPYDRDRSTIDKKINVKVEKVPSDEEGYSDTIMTVLIDCSDDVGVMCQCNVFDRYTGVSLEALEAYEYFYRMADEGTGATLAIEDKRYIFSTTITQDITTDEQLCIIFAVHHTSEYDGVVFSIGECSTEQEEFMHPRNWSEGTVPNITDAMRVLADDYFFSVTDN